MQPKFAIERFKLGRLDQLRMSHHDAMQRPVELFPPERQEFDQDRKIWRKVVVLPDIGLQQTRVIRQMIENSRGGKPISRELLDKIGRRFVSILLVAAMALTSVQVCQPEQVLTKR